MYCTHLIISQRIKSGQPRGPNATEGIPFSFTAFPQTPNNGSNYFDVWAVNELQICEMRSRALEDGRSLRESRDFPKPFMYLIM